MIETTAEKDVEREKKAMGSRRDPAGRGHALRTILKLWRNGTTPELVPFFDSLPDADPLERFTVLRADQRRRWRTGNPLPAEWYFEHFPEVEDDTELALDLIHGEYLLREENGEVPDLDDFVQRFPRFKTEIRLQAAFHHALDRPAETGHEPTLDDEEGRQRPAIPGYKILRALGEGGMGVVYLAHQMGLDRQVAIKMALANGRNDAESLRRFQREAEACACLHHPNIVEIYEIGEADGLPYFSLELVPGADLAHLINGKALPPRQAATIAANLARAMQYAHEKGVIHRDLKPANILLTPDGQPKVADFGLAKLLEKDSDQTQSGTVLGSPCYMSPEQAHGWGKEVGPAGDIYSLGAILYEMLTGSPPFHAGTPLETLRKLINDEPVRPTKLVSKVPQDLETICLKCLEKFPKRRYSSAGSLADDIERFLNFESVLARPVAAPARAWRWCKRRMSLAIAIGLAALAILTTIVLSISFAVSQYRAATKLGDALRDVRVRERMIDQSAARLAYEYGQSLCRQGDVSQGTLWLVRGLKSAAHAQDQALEQAFRLNISSWNSRLHRMRVRWEHAGGIQAIAIRPDGLIVATAGDDTTVQLWRTDDGTPVGPPLKHPSRVASVAFHPNGRLILTGCDDRRARFWDLDRYEQVGPTFHHEDTVFSVAFSPDGKTAMTGSFDKTARLWDVETGSPIGPMLRHEGPIVTVAFSPDGREAMSGSRDKTAKRWNARTGQAIGTPIVHNDVVASIDYSPDGKTILTGCYDRTARLWQRESGQPDGPPLVHQHCLAAAKFSPDGKRILTACQDGIARLWDVATRKPIGTNLRHQHTVPSVAFTPDGKKVVTGSYDRSAVIWEIVESDDLSIHHDGFIRDVIFRPDGQALLSASFDHTARLWDAGTGRPIGEPIRHAEIVNAVAFGPDGRSILTASQDNTATYRNCGRNAANVRTHCLQHKEDVKAIVISPDGKTILTGSTDKTGQLWSAVDGTKIGPPLRHDDEVIAVAFSPDGRLALTGSIDRKAKVWKTSTGTEFGEPLQHDGAVPMVGFSPDGKTILTASDDMAARLWDVETRRLRVPPLKHQGPVSVAAFSPDGLSVITGGWDRVARVWRTGTGLPEAPPLRHDGKVRALAFSPDGKTVLTGSYDRVAQLWDKRTSLPIGPPFGHESQVWFVGFSPDGRTFVTGGQEQNAYLRTMPERIDDPIDAIEHTLEIATGMALDDDGSLRVLNLHGWKSRILRLGETLQRSTD